MSQDMKVDLTLLKQLVSALEASLDAAEEIKKTAVAGTKDNVREYIIEMSKAQGVAAGIMREATGVIGDILNVVDYNTMGSPPSKTAAVEEILKKMGIKDSGNTN